MSCALGLGRRLEIQRPTALQLRRTRQARVAHARRFEQAELWKRHAAVGEMCVLAQSIASHSVARGGTEGADDIAALATMVRRVDAARVRVGHCTRPRHIGLAHGTRLPATQVGIPRLRRLYPLPLARRCVVPPPHAAQRSGISLHRMIGNGLARDDNLVEHRQGRRLAMDGPHLPFTSLEKDYPPGDDEPREGVARGRGRLGVVGVGRLDELEHGGVEVAVGCCEGPLGCEAGDT